MNITISPGNTKLGRVHNISLPPGETCPGQTGRCAAVCYASKYMKVFTSAARAYEQNLAAVILEDGWDVPILRKLSKSQPRFFRIHVAGDFFSPSYIQRWAIIARMFPKTQFLAYTRSWRVPRLRRELESLRQLPNFQLFASCDAEAHNAPKAWRKAHMGQPAYQTEGKTILCPGYGPAEPQCDACGLCFRPVPINVYFPIH